MRGLISIVIGLAVAAVLISLSGYNVGEAYMALWTGATGLEAGPAQYSNQLGLGPLPVHINSFLLAQSLAKCTPLLFTGLAVTVGLRAGLFNIGAQGQMTLGALAAGVVGAWPGHTAPPGWVHIPLILMASLAAGAAWSALAGLLKITRGVHEVLATIMLNYVAMDVATYLTTHSLQDRSDQAPQTSLVAHSALLSPLVAGSNLTVGLIIACVAACAVSLLIGRTALGFQIRAVGLSPEAAAAAGVPVARTLMIAMAISGALAGLAGAIEVLGVQHRFVQGTAASYGFDGISVALLGGLTGPGVALSALFFGALASGSAYMQLQSRVPDSVAVIVQAIVILCVGIRVLRRNQRAQPASPPIDTPDERPLAEHAPL
jgi:simple sugar transport system permease protein